MANGFAVTMICNGAEAGREAVDFTRFGIFAITSYIPYLREMKRRKMHERTRIGRSFYTGTCARIPKKRKYLDLPTSDIGFKDSHNRVFLEVPAQIPMIELREYESLI